MGSKASRTRLRANQDEVRFAEPDRALASAVADLLPELRQIATDVTGDAGPLSIRVVISDGVPRARDLYRLDPLAILWLGVPVVFIACAAALNALAFASGILCFLVAWYAVVIRRSARLLQAWWPHAGGMIMVSYGFLRPVIAVHWPRLPRPKGVDVIAFPLPDSAYLKDILAHEYAHCLLRARRWRVPPWLDEGFAFWFAEQVIGQPLFRPESRACMSESEPKGDPRSKGYPGEAYYRLMARYYWEVRDLADAGHLRAMLRASADDLKRLRRSGAGG